MAEATGIVCEVDSPFATSLVRALESMREEEGVAAIIAWIVSYRSGELRAGQFISERSERFKRVSDAFAGFYQSRLISMTYHANGAAREYLNGMDSALSKMIEIDEGMAEDPEELRAMLRTGDHKALAARLAALASDDPETAARRYLEGYERRLLDNAFLIEELSRILATEYTPRAEGARGRFTERSRTLNESTDRIGRRVSEIDSDIDELSRDETVSEEDKGALLQSFVRRRSELSKKLKKLGEQALVVGALLAECRSVTERLSDFLSRLDGQLARLTVRNDYLRRLRTAGSEPPKLDTILDNARDSLLANRVVLQETFLLLDEAFQNELLAAIDSERSIANVTVRLKDVPSVAFVPFPSQEVAAPSPSFVGASFASLDVSNDSNARSARAPHHSRRSIRPHVDPAAHPSVEPQ